jgi:GMP synthase (glutamine-hydrolysing)
MATLVIEHSDVTGSDRLGEILRDHAHRLVVIKAHQGEAIPADLDGIDALVSCGGPQSPLDDSLDWLEPEMNLLRLAHEAELPVVGLCLGCQLLARALGGEVAPLDAADGPTIEAGWHPVKLSPVGREDPIYVGIAWESMQLHWHRFHVTTPPPGARVLASSARTPVQAWTLGLRTYGLQYHPESFAHTLEAWADDDPAALEEAGITREQLRADTEQHYPAFERLAKRLFEAMTLLLMPVDRRYGLVKDLHH